MVLFPRCFIFRNPNLKHQINRSPQGVRVVYVRGRKIQADAILSFEIFCRQTAKKTGGYLLHPDRRDGWKNA